MSRTVTLVLVDAAGVALGALPPYEVPMPWWQEVGDVVAGARDRYGLDVTVLRLLTTDRAVPHGGAVTYLAEAEPGQVRAATAALGPVTVDLSGHPLRACWAAPGAPAASVAWAAAHLARLGHRVVTAVQLRAWNLSTIWRFDVPTAELVWPGLRGSQAHSSPRAGDAQTVGWLKQVPPFFGHEGAALRWLAGAVPGVAPPLLAAGEHGRLLLGHVPGEDWYDAEPAGLARIAEQMHRVQIAALPEVDALVAAGLPDRRPERIGRMAQAVAARHGRAVPGLAKLVESLPARLAAVASCGVPDTLVHGDLHPGNVRRVSTDLVILDWGDCCVGHPALDILRLTEGLSAADARPLVEAWVGRWRRDAPGSDPERAVGLLRPVAALRNAAVYADFLANIEPTERPFHAADVPIWLHRAAAGG